MSDSIRHSQVIIIITERLYEPSHHVRIAKLKVKDLCCTKTHHKAVTLENPQLFFYKTALVHFHSFAYSKFKLENILFKSNQPYTWLWVTGFLLPVFVHQNYIFLTRPGCNLLVSLFYVVLSAYICFVTGPDRAWGC